MRVKLRINTFQRTNKSANTRSCILQKLTYILLASLVLNCGGPLSPIIPVHKTHLSTKQDPLRQNNPLKKNNRTRDKDSVATITVTNEQVQKNKIPCPTLLKSVRNDKVSTPHTRTGWSILYRDILIDQEGLRGEQLLYWGGGTAFYLPTLSSQVDACKYQVHWTLHQGHPALIERWSRRIQLTLHDEKIFLSDQHYLVHLSQIWISDALSSDVRFKLKRGAPPLQPSQPPRDTQEIQSWWRLILLNLLPQSEGPHLKILQQAEDG